MCRGGCHHLGLLADGQVADERREHQRGSILLMTIIVVFILAGMRNRVNVYDAFIEGAKDGFTTAVRIIPYLVAILVGIGVFRASGAMDMLIDGIKWIVATLGGNTDFVGALPTAL